MHVDLRGRVFRAPGGEEDAVVGPTGSLLCSQQVGVGRLGVTVVAVSQRTVDNTDPRKLLVPNLGAFAGRGARRPGRNPPW